jgi:hypothetical protein
MSGGVLRFGSSCRGQVHVGGKFSISRVLPRPKATIRFKEVSFASPGGFHTRRVSAQRARRSSCAAACTGVLCDVRRRRWHQTGPPAPRLKGAPCTAMTNGSSDRCGARAVASPVLSSGQRSFPGTEFVRFFSCTSVRLTRACCLRPPLAGFVGGTHRENFETASTDLQRGRSAHLTSGGTRNILTRMQCCTSPTVSRPHPHAYTTPVPCMPQHDLPSLLGAGGARGSLPRFRCRASERRPFS